MRERDQAEAATLLRQILALVAAGELTADGPAGAAVAHRLEGAVLALDSLRTAVISSSDSDAAG
jgi:hypothetical protein